MTLKCPRCGKKGVRMVDYKRTYRYGGSASKSYQIGTLKCEFCTYSEVLKGVF